MNKKIIIGSEAYIIENARTVSKVHVIDYDGEFYTLRLVAGGMTKLRKSRIYTDISEARKVAPESIRVQAARRCPHLPNRLYVRN